MNRSRLKRRWLLATGFALTIASASLSAWAAESPARSALGLPVGQHAESLDPADADGLQRVSVFIELSADSAVETFVAERDAYLLANPQRLSGEALQASAERSGARLAFDQAADLATRQRVLIDELARRFDAHVLFNTRFATNGIAVRVPASRVVELRQLPGVQSVSPLVSHQLDAATSLDFTGVRTFWGNVAPDLGLRGSGIGVGVIDTGIDHMHTEFGGPGGSNYKLGVTTATPYPAPPTVPVAANFPTPKVVWGYDFVGDGYNAAGTTDAQLIPNPDPNPMDGGTHGTSVASLIAGLGVNADGSSYAGPYDRTQPNVQSPSMRISPGYAPASPLYAFRVFGNAGSTQLTAAALDSAAAIYLWQSDTSIPWDGQVSGTVFNAAGQPVVINYTLPQPPATPRLRIINLSLGSSDGDIEELSALAAQRTADAGVIVVLSAGNSYDSYYITGSPGVASGGISVAASINDQLPGGIANAPANGGQAALTNFEVVQFGNASFSSAALAFPATDVVYARPNLADYLAPTPPGITPSDPGQLVTLKDEMGNDINLFANNGGTLEVSFNPAATNIYAGKVVLVDRGAVGFHQKGLAAARAGAAAVIIVNSTAAFGGMAANANLPTIAIPSAMVTQPVGGSFTDGGGLNTGVARVAVARPGLTLQVLATTPVLQDTMAIYSSRGPRRTDDGIKPDITAPAEVVTVASSGSGNGVSGFNGTSSAAPHTAGAMALLRQLNPTWTNYELKALLLNNASQDVFVNAGANLTTPPSGVQWGVSRQGVGRWDLQKYAGGGTKVILFGQDPLPTSGGASRRGNVNVSFGVVDVTQPTVLERDVIVRNKSSMTQTFSVGFAAIASTPGVSYALPDGNLITLSAQSERTIRIRMSADPTQMRHAREPGLRPFQFLGNLSTRFPRQFMNEAAGYITLTPSGGSEPSHRLTVQAFPRRASSLSASNAELVADTAGQLNLAGSGYNTGTAREFTNADFSVLPEVVDIVSFVKPLELTYSGTAATGITPMQRAGDIRYVGITSDYSVRTDPLGAAPAVLLFGVSTFGEFDTTQSGAGSEFVIEVDLNSDNVADRVIRQLAFTNPEAGTSRSNIMLPAISSTPPFSSFSSTGWSLNVFPNIYSNLYNNSNLLIPINVAGANSLGLTAGATRFGYRVIGLHRGSTISLTPWLSYDPAAPGVVFPGVTEPSMVEGVDGAGVPAAIPVVTNAANLAANGSGGVLVLYPMNAYGNRAQVVPVVLADEIFADGFEE